MRIAAGLLAAAAHVQAPAPSTSLANLEQANLTTPKLDHQDLQLSPLFERCGSGSKSTGMLASRALSATLAPCLARSAQHANCIVSGLFDGRLWGLAGHGSRAISTGEEAASYDACIVGAGPAGLAAAIKLKQARGGGREMTGHGRQPVARGAAQAAAAAPPATTVQHLKRLPWQSASSSPCLLPACLPSHTSRSLQRGRAARSACA